MSHWLVRTAKNVISGPYNREALCQMILSGELGSQDEVCDSGQYWIFLHERDEVARQLGINLPKPPKNPDEETTETQTQTQTQTRTDSMLNAEHTPVPMSVTAAEAEVIAATDASTVAEDEEDDGATQVLGTRSPAPSNGHARAAVQPASTTATAAVAAAVSSSADVGSALVAEGSALPAAESTRNMNPLAEAEKPLPPPNGQKVVYRPMVLGEIERPSAWRMAIWILVIAAFFLAFWMLRALRR